MKYDIGSTGKANANSKRLLSKARNLHKISEGWFDSREILAVLDSISNRNTGDIENWMDAIVSRGGSIWENSKVVS